MGNPGEEEDKFMNVVVHYALSLSRTHVSRNQERALSYACLSDNSARKNVPFLNYFTDSMHR